MLVTLVHLCLVQWFQLEHQDCDPSYQEPSSAYHRLHPPSRVSHAKTPSGSHNCCLITPTAPDWKPTIFGRLPSYAEMNNLLPFFAKYFTMENKVLRYGSIPIVAGLLNWAKSACDSDDVLSAAISWHWLAAC